MLACQRILGLCGVIELRALPLRRGVTQDAILRETRRNVIGTLCSLKILQMATLTSCWQALEDVVHVAASASSGDMLARQREFGRVVIELSSLPLRGGVAQLAGLRESRSNVIHTLGCLIVLEVTR